MTSTDPKKGAALRDLRRWHLGAAAGLPLPPEALPALLAPFRDPARVRHDYPLVLEPDGDGLKARPFGEVLAELAQHCRAQARVMQDNLGRLERRVRLLLREQPMGDAGQLLQAAGEQMIAEMQLSSEVATGVRDDLGTMLQALPEIELLPLGGSTALQLLSAVARRRVGAARRRVAERVQKSAEVLRQLLAVETQKDPAARDGGTMQKSLGGAATRFLDPAVLARSVGKHRGSVAADPERLGRLQNALATLDGYLAAEPMPELVLAYRDQAPAVDGASLQQSDDVCAGAAARFDKHAAALMPVVRAAYLTELEQRGDYRSERHDPLLQAMSWHDLSCDELHALPAIVAVTPAKVLVGSGIQQLSRLLTSGRPVQVLLQQSPSHDPLDSTATDGEATPTRSRLELGYLGIAFREAYVQQTTAARPVHLLAGLQRALHGTRPGLHLVDSGLGDDGLEHPLGAFLYAGAAIEGRAHPLFQYDPEAGETWARRLDFTLNPSPEEDWPGSEIKVAGDRRLLRFTFADYALLDPRLRDSFALVPDGVASEELVEVADYLELADEDARHRIPFVWIATGDPGSALQRVAVRRQLINLCRDRRRFWRTLQELAGVRNDYVREAVQRARQEAGEQAAREREALAAQHREELEAVRAEATGAAMQGLARMLLELDPMAEAPTLVSRPAATAPSPTSEAPPAAPAADPPADAAIPETAAAEAEDDGGYDEPWIESVRCSTCNDCININSLLFVYDDNKQARIGDLKAGTYAQLVQAAEKCPSRCIHPGKPLNPNEPNLEALVARAAPFN